MTCEAGRDELCGPLVRQGGALTYEQMVRQRDGLNTVGWNRKGGPPSQSVYGLKVKLHYAYKVRNIGRFLPRLRFCVLC